MLNIALWDHRQHLEVAERVDAGRRSQPPQCYYIIGHITKLSEQKRMARDTPDRQRIMTEMSRGLGNIALKLGLC